MLRSQQGEFTLNCTSRVIYYYPVVTKCCELLQKVSAFKKDISIEKAAIFMTAAQHAPYIPPRCVRVDFFFFFFIKRQRYRAYQTPDKGVTPVFLSDILLMFLWWNTRIRKALSKNCKALAKGKVFALWTGADFCEFNDVSDHTR